MLSFTILIDAQNDNQKDKLIRLYQTYKEDIYRIAVHFLNDLLEAEDVVQSVIMKIAKNLDKIDENEFNKTTSYIYIITKNCCHDMQRKKRSIDLIPVDLMDHIYPEIFSHYEVYFDLIGISNHLAVSLNNINELYADIITLRYFNDFSIKEISEILGISENNVSVRIHRAINELKKIISTEELHDEKTRE